MDEAAVELLRVYRRRVATWQAAYERVSRENRRLQEQLDQAQQLLWQHGCHCQLCEPA